MRCAPCLLVDSLPGHGRTDSDGHPQIEGLTALISPLEAASSYNGGIVAYRGERRTVTPTRASKHPCRKEETNA